MPNFEHVNADWAIHILCPWDNIDLETKIGMIC